MAANNGRVCTEDWGTGEWNHAWSSSPGSFLQKHVSGISPTGPGFGTFIVRPVVEGGLTFAESTVPTVRGDIATRWEKLPGRNSLMLDVTVPANSTAEVRLPFTGPTAPLLEEGGTPLPPGGRGRGAVPGVRSVAVDDGYITITIGSGTYHFVVSG
jgi:hypothetical protein